MATKYTPGPWKDYAINKAPLRYMVCAGDKGELGVVKTVLDSEISVSEQLANARLIAAAPDMYEALKSIYGWLLDLDVDGTGDKPIPPEDEQFWRPDFIKAHNLTLAALSKAEGIT